MPRQSKSSAQSKKVETLKHSDATRKNIPTAEYQSVMAEEEKRPIREPTGKGNIFRLPRFGEGESPRHPRHPGEDFCD